jgi:hypothetical protein
MGISGLSQFGTNETLPPRQRAIPLMWGILPASKLLFAGRIAFD